MLILLAAKSVVQSFSPDPLIGEMMETFRQMVNDCLRVGLANDVSALKKLSKLCYPALDKYDIISYYKLSRCQSKVDRVIHQPKT